MGFDQLGLSEAVLEAVTESGYENPTPIQAQAIPLILEGRDVIVVEGVCASGLSLSYLLRNFETRHPASLRVCAFLIKQRTRPVEVKIDYVGCQIPDAFVVGYGLDAGERHRNLPYVARLP